MSMLLPINLYANHARFSIDRVDEMASQQLHQTAVEVSFQDYRGQYARLVLPLPFLLAVADLIYGAAGRAPQLQAVRVEVVPVAPPAAAAPSEAAPRPRLQLVDRDDPPGDQVDAIRARMLSGK